jgi:hypothetical protein
MLTKTSELVPPPGRSSPGTGLPLNFLTWFHAPWTWLAFCALALALDYLSGPFVRLSILFIFPVAAAAWHHGLRVGLPLALLLPWFRLLFYWMWEVPWTWVDSGATCLVRAVVLAAFAVVTAHLRRQADQIRLLRGLLPICAYCKKIRDNQGTWHPLESYVSSQTEARLSHGICPVCLRQLRVDSCPNAAG